MHLSLLLFSISLLFNSFTMERDYLKPHFKTKELDEWLEDQIVNYDSTSTFSGKWKNEEHSPNVKQTDGFIRRKDTYTPYSLDTNKNEEVLAIVAHGTWGDETPDYYDLSNKNYSNMRNFAAYYGEKNRCKVNFQSFQWSGEWSDLKRGNSAVILSNYIKKNHNDKKTVFMTHSHGGNVINQVTHLLNNPADLLVYFACPVRGNYLLNHPNKFNKLVYFHSDKDTIAFGGRIHEEDVLKKHGAEMALYCIGGALTAVVTYKIYHEPTLNEFHKSIEIGSSTYRKDIKLYNMMDYLMKFSSASVGLNFPVIKLGGLTGQAYRNYKKFNTNIFPVQENKNMIGIHSKINSKFLGHSEVTNMSEFLPEIMDQLDTKFPTYGTNMLLEADCNTELYKTDPANAVVMQYDSRHTFPEKK